MSTLPDSASIWVVRSPDGERVCTREGDRFLPARTPWLREHLSLLILFAENDFRARYRAQALGVVWSLLQPLVMMGILSLVFTRAFHSTEPHFPVFLLIGLLAWQWIAASLNSATLAFVLQADMVKRTIFPRALLPISAVLSYGINALVESIALIALIPFFPGAFHVSWALLAIPGLVLCLGLLLAGASVAVSVLNVIYRDVAYLVSTGLLLLYWLTPIIYPPSLLPEPWHQILAWNPLGAIVTGLRDVILHGHAPSALEWAQAVGPTLFVALVGVAIYRRFESEMLDHV
jgi:ABC-type polysaccharide/polyol phosphate export permease